MLQITPQQHSDEMPCSYLHAKNSRFEYFFATDVSAEELDFLLESGWRKFGMYYFRPDCVNCLNCIPIRIQTKKFKPSKTQKRVLKKREKITMRTGPLQFKKEIFDIYRIHSRDRFQRETNDIDEFYHSFYLQSCPSMQSEYYIDNILAAVGFIDQSSNSLSSVYLAYDTAYEKYSLGTLSVIMEIELAASLGLEYYYLGYVINENHSMAYKGSFYPHELYDWPTQTWKVIDKKR